MKIVFSERELQWKSLFWKKCNVKENATPKEALDFMRMTAVIGYTCSQFPNVSALHIKQSLASMLAKEYTGESGEDHVGGTAED